MRLLAQPREIFDGSEAGRQTEHDINRHKPAKLKPGKRRPINPKPQCLPDDHIGLCRLFPGKATVKEIDERQCSSGERNQHEDKEPPARPDEWKCSCDHVIQTAPSHDHQKERCDPKWLEFELVIHRQNYTRALKVESSIK